MMYVPEPQIGNCLLDNSHRVVNYIEGAELTYSYCLDCKSMTDYTATDKPTTAISDEAVSELLYTFNDIAIRA